jgi:hypothetical protein
MELNRKAVIENPDLLARALRHYYHTLTQIRKEGVGIFSTLGPTALERLLSDYPIKRWVDDNLKHLEADIEVAEKGDVNILEGLFDREEPVLREAMFLYTEELNEAVQKNRLDVLKPAFKEEMNKLRKCIIPTGKSP